MKELRKRIFKIIEIGNKDDVPSALFDGFIVIVILLNLIVTLAQTFEQLKPYHGTLDLIELITIMIFTVEYLLRIWTADMLYPEEKDPLTSRLKFIFSLFGLIDLFTIIPYFLPFIFPAGAVAFRILRVIRIFRLFKINAQYDAFNVIVSVIKEKKNQLVSSLSMIIILMLASSLCMYSLEHEAQPDQFKNAFSGIWWSVSTLLTVGYGDLYPVTAGGRFMAIIISFLGVGMVAIPTGIISAGFVEQYSEFKIMGGPNDETNPRFITSKIAEGSRFDGIRVGNVEYLPDMTPVMVIRGEEKLVPEKDLVLKAGDIIVTAVKSLS
ncbi:MAG: ion transporter [Lachnospiraceae bacterium]|nr:ion transporter [Lachnospiraceae bacterium]